jgi:hypothetical protein
MITMDKEMLYKRYIVFNAPNSPIFAIDINFDSTHRPVLYMWDMQDWGKCDVVNNRVRIIGVDLYE